LASTEIIFKATSEEAQLIKSVIEEKFPRAYFSLSKVSYPSYNGVHCFEIQADPKNLSAEMRFFIDEYLIAFSASRA